MRFSAALHHTYTQLNWNAFDRTNLGEKLRNSYVLGADWTVIMN